MSRSTSLPANTQLEVRIVKQCACDARAKEANTCRKIKSEAYFGLEEATDVMNEVRASVCRPKERSTLSRYEMTSSNDNTTPFSLVTSALTGSKISAMLSVGVEGREGGGETGGRCEFVLYGYDCQKTDEDTSKEHRSHSASQNKELTSTPVR